MPNIRVATYNIHGCIDRGRRFDPLRIAGVLNELDVDVIALQELASLHTGPDVLALLADRTGMRGIAGPTQRGVERTYGNAMLVRGDVLNAENVDLSVPLHEPRGALDVTLSCQGLQLRIIATHLGLRPAERRRQVRTVLTRVASSNLTPMVLMGDMNEWFRWGRPVRWLHSAFRATPAPRTFPANLPLFALDRIWVQPHHLLREVAVHTTLEARGASDHLPLVAVIDTEKASTTWRAQTTGSHPEEGCIARVSSRPVGA